MPGWGTVEARLLVVGLAPGLKGANRTGRVFTGDAAGWLLFRTLASAGFATGASGHVECDDLAPSDCRITNAVRCVPPSNKPSKVERQTCRPFLRGKIDGNPGLRVILALGHLADAEVLGAMGLKPSSLPFGHGAMHTLPGGIELADSYHVSRLNQNTGLLTPAMFANVVDRIRARLG